MPYFAWQALDSSGQWYQGRAFARSEDEIAASLQGRNMVMLMCHPIRTAGYTTSSLSLGMRAYIFKQLATLLEAGVLLPDAVLLIVHHIPAHKRFVREFLYTILMDIHAGASLAQALVPYHTQFGPLTLALVQTGEETAQLPSVLHIISTYWHDRAQLTKDLYAALLVPGITLGCFFLVLLLVFYWIVPALAAIFQTTGKPLATTTRIMINVSESIRGISLLQVLHGVVGGISVWIIVRVYARIRWYKDMLMLHLPLVRSITILRLMLGLAQSLSILLAGGVPLLTALHISREIIDNVVIARYWDTIVSRVEDGLSLSQAMQALKGDYFPQDLVSLIVIGEESERLSVLLSRAADVMKERLQVQLTLLTQLLQPCCMLIVGCLVALLIVALYMPLFDISHQVSTW